MLKKKKIYIFHFTFFILFFILNSSSNSELNHFQTIQIEIEKTFETNIFKLSQDNLVTIIDMEKDIVATYIASKKSNENNETIEYKSILYAYQNSINNYLNSLITKKSPSENEKKFLDIWKKNRIFLTFFFEKKYVFIPVLIENFEFKEENNILSFRFDLEPFSTILKELNLKKENIIEQAKNGNILYYFHLQNQDYLPKTILDKLKKVYPENSNPLEKAKSIVTIINNSKKYQSISYSEMNTLSYSYSNFNAKELLYLYSDFFKIYSYSYKEEKS